MPSLLLSSVHLDSSPSQKSSQRAHQPLAGLLGMLGIWYPPLPLPLSPRMRLDGTAPFVLMIALVQLPQCGRPAPMAPTPLWVDVFEERPCAPRSGFRSAWPHTPPWFFADAGPG